MRRRLCVAGTADLHQHEPELVSKIRPLVLGSTASTSKNPFKAYLETKGTVAKKVLAAEQASQQLTEATPPVPRAVGCLVTVAHEHTSMHARAAGPRAMFVLMLCARPRPWG